MNPGDLIVRNATWLDIEAGDYCEGDLEIRDGRFVDVDAQPSVSDVREIDAAGAYVLPGLIDCHVHVTAHTADLPALGTDSPNYVAMHTARLMGDMLDRGFTTVRDVAGADYGLHDAQVEGLLRGPRLFFGGKALSQTGGHADPRGRGESYVDSSATCSHIGRVVDGVDAVRAAARDELRKGAHHIKIMAGGGVASPTDRIDSTQFSLDEITAVVEEAEAANRYVAAHAYTGRAINRALRAGVRSIEHGNLMDDESVALFLEHDAFVTMNLVTYWALMEEGREFGLSQENWEKVSVVLDGGMTALERAYRGGVNLCYGTDLLGGMHRHQSREFALRAEVVPIIDIIRSATSTAARLIQREGELGVIAPGAFGDLIVLDRDPLRDVSVLADARPSQVIQAGKVVAAGG
ncbi:MAG: amidohydrolase family protein [Micropruina sp.]|uniref:metal-dependent hydrolase family protein n=1 Tax=Micropruina sp. TaxID=2737536 RepID=UPI0039E33569